MSFRSILNVGIWVILYLVAAMNLLYAGPSEITEDVYTIDALQALIGYHIEANYLMGGVCPPSHESIEAGDSYDQLDQGNFSKRSLISFPVQSIPEQYHLDSAILKLHQRYCVGNWFNQVFPIWYNGLYYPCLVAEVDYGDTVEQMDFFTPVIADIGMISDDNIIGWHSLDVSDAYRTDLNAGNQYCQFMLYFHIVSDYDNGADWIAFDNSHTQYEGCMPRLELHYINDTSVEEQVNDVSAITIYPNPVKDKVEIKSNDGSYLSQIEIFNIKGQVVATENVNRTQGTELSMYLSKYKLKPGVYFFRLSFKQKGKQTHEYKKVMLL